MRLEIYDKYFSSFRVFFSSLVIVIAITLTICLLNSIPVDASIFIAVISGITLSALLTMVSAQIGVVILRKRVKHDRITLLPEIKLEYDDFEDNQSWVIVRRHRYYGKYDTEGVHDINLMNRAGEYLLEDWCDYLTPHDLPANPEIGKDSERIYVMHYKDERQNLIYCHGHNRMIAEVVFDEPVQSFGSLFYEYIKVVFTDGSVNYVKLSNGTILFAENLPGGFGIVKK